MRTTAVLDLSGCPPSALFHHIESLDRYPPWMRLVHRVQVVCDPVVDVAKWDVELRARVGPFARSKQLRMARTVHEPDHHVRFERVVLDGRDQASWVLDATVEPFGDGSRLRMELAYSGDLWGTGALSRVLNDEIRRGRESLRAAVMAFP
jgi:hypothetical protein